MDEYRFKSVKYSESELLNAYEIVNEYAELENEIVSADIDVFQNRIIVGIKNVDDIKAIYNALIEIEGMYAFELLPNDYSCHNIATIDGLSAINNGRIYSTPAGKVYCSSIKGWEIVTCGHGWKTGDTVSLGGVKIGTVRARYYDGKNDSSLIILGSGHEYQGTKHDEIDSTVPVAGSTLTLRGTVSGKITGANVLSTNSSSICDEMYCTGLIRCDKPLKPGDSGGGAIGGYADGGRTACIVAINKATSASDLYLIKGKVICDAY